MQTGKNNPRNKIVTKIRKTSLLIGVENPWFVFPPYAQDLLQCHLFLYRVIRPNKQKFGYETKRLIREVKLDEDAVQQYFSSDRQRFEIKDRYGQPFLLEQEQALVVPVISDQVRQERSTTKIKRQLKFLKLETDVQQFFEDFELVNALMNDQQKKTELKRYIPFADREHFNDLYAPGAANHTYQDVKSEFILKYQEEHLNHKTRLKNLKLSESSSVLGFVEEKLNNFQNFEGKKEPECVWATLEQLVDGAPFLAPFVGNQNSQTYKKEFKFIEFLKQLTIEHQLGEQSKHLKNSKKSFKFKTMTTFKDSLTILAEKANQVSGFEKIVVFLSEHTAKA